ncbi:MULTISPECIES: hypothetical protein [Okeania]|uniref:Uncharacterized protein n=1 Tax=Okeania hirsuta TaxID=1458930 RepID=A0A3N6P6Z9_9CYAN|nr:MULTISPECIES: hypothetical protein [Okeania]NES89260.1 hypothetical protein [Okeania sp. SIO2B9]RQH18619.1 hypothetical protein D4Z78_14940 [Okeania hirsuta]RQH26131.1 hypothetical protein D5R40_28525 [Okeania hirsuta]
MATPTFQVSILNGETVIVFPEQFGAPQKIIITLTQADFLHHNKTQKELAQEWQKTISSKMSEGIREKDPRFYTEEQLNDFKKSIFFILVTLVLSFDVFWLQRICKIFYLNTRNQLKILEKLINLDQ